LESLSREPRTLAYLTQPRSDPKSRYRFHRTSGASSVDAARVNRLQLQGFLVLQFTYLLVVDAPQDVVADVRDALGRTDVDRAG
jgi:hypothetical protein